MGWAHTLGNTFEWIIVSTFTYFLLTHWFTNSSSYSITHWVIHLWNHFSAAVHWISHVLRPCAGCWRDVSASGCALLWGACSLVREAGREAATQTSNYSTVSQPPKRGVHRGRGWWEPGGVGQIPLPGESVLLQPTDSPRMQTQPPASWQNNNAHDAIVPGCCQVVLKSSRKGYCLESDNGKSVGLDRKGSGWNCRCFIQSFLHFFILSTHLLSTYYGHDPESIVSAIMEFKISYGAWMLWYQQS